MLCFTNLEQTRKHVPSDILQCQEHLKWQSSGMLVFHMYRPQANLVQTSNLWAGPHLFFFSGLADVAQGSVLTEREASRKSEVVYDTEVI